jgi:hypothetical protein
MLLILICGFLISLNAQHQLLGIDTISRPDVKKILHTINNILVSYDDSIDAINDMFIDGDTLHGNGGNRTRDTYNKKKFCDKIHAKFTEMAEKNDLRFIYYQYDVIDWKGGKSVDFFVKIYHNENFDPATSLPLNELYLGHRFNNDGDPIKIDCVMWSFGVHVRPMPRFIIKKDGSIIDMTDKTHPNYRSTKKIIGDDLNKIGFMDLDKHKVTFSDK